MFSAFSSTETTSMDDIYLLIIPLIDSIKHFLDLAQSSLVANLMIPYELLVNEKSVFGRVSVGRCCGSGNSYS